MMVAENKGLKTEQISKLIQKIKEEIKKIPETNQTNKKYKFWLKSMLTNAGMQPILLSPLLGLAQSIAEEPQDLKKISAAAGKCMDAAFEANGTSYEGYQILAGSMGYMALGLLITAGVLCVLQLYPLAIGCAALAGVAGIAAIALKVKSACALPKQKVEQKSFPAITLFMQRATLISGEMTNEQEKQNQHKSFFEIYCCRFGR